MLISQPVRPCIHRMFPCGMCPCASVTRSDDGGCNKAGSLVLLLSCAVTSTIVRSGHRFTREHSMDTSVVVESTQSESESKSESQTSETESKTESSTSRVQVQDRVLVKSYRTILCMLVWIIFTTFSIEGNVDVTKVLIENKYMLKAVKYAYT